MLFICILVNADEIDLEQKNVTLGEICNKLVRCLYMKFTAHKDIPFICEKFEKVLNWLGKLAWKTLNSKMYHLQLTEIGDDLRNDPFEYGILVGHEDFRLVGHETADVFVTFLHTSIQEFLGGFYFMKMLTDGASIEGLPFIDSMWPIFMVNPLFLYFCLYLLYEKQTYFGFQKRNLYEYLRQFMSEKINMTQLHLERLYPALEINNRNKFKTEFGLNLFYESLELCSRTTEIMTRCKDLLTQTQLSDHCPMPNLRLVSSVARFVPVTGPLSLFRKTPSENEVNVLISHPKYGSIDDLVAYCKLRGKSPSLYFQPATETTDLCEYVKGNIRKVYICGDSLWTKEKTSLTAESNIDICPFLTHLYLSHMTIGESVLHALSEAMKEGKLPVLRHLSFEGGFFALYGKLSVLFDAEWPTLTYLNLKGCHLLLETYGHLCFALLTQKIENFPN